MGRKAKTLIISGDSGLFMALMVKKIPNAELDGRQACRKSI
jgi:hypothetical protein